MKKIYIIILSFLFLCSASFILAQDPFDNLVYPIAGLGNCENKETCGLYCDEEENMSVCLDYAEQHQLMPEKDIEMGRKMIEIGEKSGPGGCKSHEECKTYCDNINNIRECITFAQENDLMDEKEIEESKKVMEAVERGIKPPNCMGREECDIYCYEPEHMEECLVFSEAAGLMPEKERGEAKKVLEALRKGVKPPNCRGEAECDKYCSQEEHFEECINFSVAAGFMSEKDAEMSRRTGGKGPGDCRGKECETYCDDSAHNRECMEFSIKYGLMPPEHIERAKKMLELGIVGGPGGCTAEEDCKAFCDNPNNARNCIEFGVKVGDMTQEEADRMFKNMERGGDMGGPGGCQSEEECQAYCENPDNMKECMDFPADQGMMPPEGATEIKRGGGEEPPMMDDNGEMKEIYEEMMPGTEPYMEGMEFEEEFQNRKREMEGEIREMGDEMYGDFKEPMFDEPMGEPKDFFDGPKDFMEPMPGSDYDKEEQLETDIDMDMPNTESSFEYKEKLENDFFEPMPIMPKEEQMEVFNEVLEFPAPEVSDFIEINNVDNVSPELKLEDFPGSIFRFFDLKF